MKTGQKSRKKAVGQHGDHTFIFRRNFSFDDFRHGDTSREAPPANNGKVHSASPQAAGWPDIIHAGVIMK